MLKTAALTALVMLDNLRPQPVPRAERYISKRVPMLGLVPKLPDVPEFRRPAKPRKRHVCTWTDQEVWGACAFALILGVLIGVCF